MKLENGAGGIRTRPESTENLAALKERGAETGAQPITGINRVADPELAALVAAGPSLPEPIRRAMLALLSSVKGTP